MTSARFSLLLCAVFPPAAPAGEPAGRAADGAPDVRARLLAERTALVPGGKAWLAVELVIEKGWHVYGPFRNDSGLPVKVEVRAPEGFRAGEPLWPAPKRLVSPGDLLDHVYEGRLLLLFPLEVPASARPGRIEIQARVAWLACKEACVPGKADAALKIQVASPKEEAGAAPDAPAFEEARARIPRDFLPPAAASLETSFAVPPEGGPPRNLLRVKAWGAKGLAFFPSADGAAPADPIARCEAVGDRLEIEFPAEGEGPSAASGILEIRGATGTSFHRLACPLPAPPPAAKGPGEGGEDARRGVAVADLNRLRAAIHAFENDMGGFPGAGRPYWKTPAYTAEPNRDLVRALKDPAAPNAPYLEFNEKSLAPSGEFLDPWGNPYRYVLRHEGGRPALDANGRFFYLYSCGPNGKDDTDDARDGALSAEEISGNTGDDVVGW